MKYRVSSPMRCCPERLLGEYIPVGQSAEVEATPDQIAAAKAEVFGLQVEKISQRKPKDSDDQD